MANEENRKLIRINEEAKRNISQQGEQLLKTLSSFRNNASMILQDIPDDTDKILQAVKDKILNGYEVGYDIDAVAHLRGKSNAYNRLLRDWSRISKNSTYKLFKEFLLVDKHGSYYYGKGYYTKMQESAGVYAVGSKQVAMAEKIQKFINQYTAMQKQDGDTSPGTKQAERVSFARSLRSVTITTGFELLPDINFIKRY